MTACHPIHLIDKVSVSPHGLFLYPARHSKKRKGKINIYAEVKKACNEQASRAVFAYPGLGQKLWIASVVSVYLKKKNKNTTHTHKTFIGKLHSAHSKISLFSGQQVHSLVCGHASLSFAVHREGTSEGKDDLNEGWMRNLRILVPLLFSSTFNNFVSLHQQLAVI